MGADFLKARNFHTLPKKSHMEDFFLKIFGTGTDLSPGQMTARAFVMFFITLVLIRISGMRSFGSKSPFDTIIVIMLGAVLSRAVVGASPFISTVFAGVTICVVHRLVAMLCTRNHLISNFMKGKPLTLYKDGEINRKNMLRCDLSNGDLEEGIRIAANTSSLDELKEVKMERSGKISAVKK
jgi:uncharacterized membrane protein YcaP (DUF421 family)